MRSGRMLRLVAALMVLGVASFAFTGTAIAQKKKKFDKKAAKEEITAIYETFINPANNVEQRITVVEENDNPEVIDILERAFAASGGTARAETLKIKFVNRKLATVDFGIFLSDEMTEPVIVNEGHFVVLTADGWRMSLDSYCILSETGGNPCSSELLEQAATLLATAKKAKKL